MFLFLVICMAWIAIYYRRVCWLVVGLFFGLFWFVLGLAFGYAFVVVVSEM